MNSGKRRWSEKRFQYCTNPSSSKQFLHLPAIHGHSGDNAVDPTLQDNLQLPKRFTEYNNHVGNANELNSKVRNALIPGGTSLKRGRQAVIFTTVNTMEDVYGMGENTMEIFRNQGSRHTRVLGNAFNRQYFGAI